MISQNTARKLAYETLRFKIGTIPYLGDADETEHFFVYPILYRNAELSESQEPIRFYEERQIGKIKFEKSSGNITRTDNVTLKDRISDIEEECENGELDVVRSY